MVIEYPLGKQYELLVRDTGRLDYIDIYVNGTLRRHLVDRALHRIPITRPDTGEMRIKIVFEGIDGGKSAVVDATDDAENPSLLSQQSGLVHDYTLKASDA